MVGWGSGYPSRLSLWRHEFDSRTDRTKIEIIFCLKGFTDSTVLEFVLMDETMSHEMNV